jgi:hypothetical protein
MNEGVSQEPAAGASDEKRLARPAGARWRAIALPPEHGSWGLVGEPVVLGLLVAPAWTSFLVGLGAFAGFLAYRPAKLVWGDLRRRKRYPRTALAVRLAAVVLLAAAGWLPWLAASAVALLLARAAWGLSRHRRPATARAVGFGEIAWGVVTVLLVAAGSWS